MFCFYDTTIKHVCLSPDVTYLYKNHGTWKGLKTNIIKLEEDDFDETGEFGRDDKDDENFELQPDVQSIIVEEKPAVCDALHKLQTFYNDAPAAITTPRRLQSVRELHQADSGR